MPLRSVIVGTAGHIDHGKTALVKALTGIDADRLEEEKRRGITIDIGFAHMELPSPDGGNVRFSFVDVPGHERFVRNMLAGIGGIDLVLLIIAADEGIMPQTREHFEICRLLGIARGITVLTKADKVSREKLEETRQAVQHFLRGSFLDTKDSAIVAVSATNGEGLDDLRRELLKYAAQLPSRDSQAALRLPIDRVFSMKGFGTVVTGTLVSGEVRAADELEALPGGKRVRVRGVQVHGSAVHSAQAGERTALNLTAVQKDDLSRGMTLARPGMFQTTTLVDARLDLLSEAGKLKAGARFHLHSYTSETIATVARFDASAGFARLNLAEPLLLFPGDRFILRRFSPVVTVGGGIVLDASPIKKMPPAERIEFLETMRTGDAASQLLARINRQKNNGLTFAEAVAETGWTRAKIETISSDLLRNSVVVRVHDTLIATQHFAELQRRVVEALRAFHEQDPLAPGMAREELRNNLGAPSEIFAALASEAVKTGKIEDAGENIRLAGRGITLRDDEADARRTIESAFFSAGLKVPALKDVLAALPLDKVRAHKIVTLLLREGVLVKIGDDLVFHASALKSLRQTIQQYKTKSPTIDVTRFKDMTQVSRKYAIPLLEFLDRERVTRRQGDVRIIL